MMRVGSDVNLWRRGNGGDGGNGNGGCGGNGIKQRNRETEDERRRQRIGKAVVGSTGRPAQQADTREGIDPRKRARRNQHRVRFRGSMPSRASLRDARRTSFFAVFLRFSVSPDTPG